MDEDKAGRQLHEIRLVEERGSTSRFVHARIEANGDLVVGGQDVGKAPQRAFGDGDYEFWVTVAAEDKDRLLLALMEKLYAGRFSAVDEFRDFLKERDIPYCWMTW